ncbi:50S ribosomal protein L10 [Candidatus Parcubacteria bacterium]|jgi:large subunit ribosomal protein L10|nr:50S ribosomal protein L10 [Candidatus Parcubacteria bacterium]
MAKTKEQKKKILDVLKDKIAKSKSVVFSSDNGATVQSVESLRKELRDNGAEYLVTKKTLLKLATKDVEGENQVEDLSGSVGLTLSYEDEATGANVVNKFAKKQESFELSGGILEGGFILPEKIKVLATLPSREQLLAKLVGSIQSPITGMVRVLSGNTRDLVGVLNAIKEKKS